MQRFKSQGQAQKFVSTQSAIYNTFSIQRHLISRHTMRNYRSAAMSAVYSRSSTLGGESGN